MALWGNTDDANSVPKYLSDADKQNAKFIDTTEAADASNRAKGIKTGGWNLYETYTTNGGAVTRYRVEPLVAMTRTNAEAGDNDTIAPAPVITFTSQTLAVAVTANTDDAIFSVSAAVTQGATLSYQWQWVDSASAGADPLVWNDVTFGTGATTDTFNAGTFGTGDNGALFRVIVSATGAEDAISSNLTLTVNP